MKILILLIISLSSFAATDKSTIIYKFNSGDKITAQEINESKKNMIGLVVDDKDNPTKCIQRVLKNNSYKLSNQIVDCATGSPIGLSQRDGAYEIGTGLNLSSCQSYQNHPLYTGQGDGTYWIDPLAQGASGEHIVYCDMDDVANIAWTLIFSSQTVIGTADRGSLVPSANLATLTPSGSMTAVYTPYNSVTELKFECDGGKNGIDYSVKDIPNTIYGVLKGRVSEVVTEISLGNNNILYSNGSLDNPDFVIVNPIISSTSSKWGTYNGAPYTVSGSLSRDNCNGTSYGTRTGSQTPGELSISNAYFYIWVR